MKFHVILAAVVLSTTAATSAMAAGPYVGAAAGVSVFHDSDLSLGGDTAELSYDMGGAVNVSAGYDFGGLRVEGEFGYKGADVDKLEGIKVEGDATIMSLMANGFYDFKMASPVTPFVGVGIGFIKGELDDGFDSSDDTALGYQLSVGAAMQVAPNVHVDLTYRYQSTFSDFKMDGVDVSYGSSNVLAGVRLNF